MDPLIHISQDIHYLILQHFTARDVFSASEVSELWSESVNSSSNCMNRIKLVMKFRNKLGTRQEQIGEAINLLKNTNRFYRSIAIDCKCNKSLSFELGEFLNRAGEKVSEMKIKSVVDLLPDYHLPKLQVLKLTYVAVNVRDMILSKTSSLKSLKLKMDQPLEWNKNKTPKASIESLECLRKFVNNNCELAALEIHGAVQYSSFFSQDISKAARFKLKSLKVKNGMRLSLIAEENETNLIKFLASQASSLNSFFIDVCRPNVIQHVFNKLPNLTSLHLDVMFMDNFKIEDLSLQLNEKIVDLKIPYVNDDIDIKEILSLTPNLSSLFIALLSHDITQFIAFNLKNLEILKYRCDQLDSDVFYDQLKLDFPDVNQHIQMIIDYEYK